MHRRTLLQCALGAGLGAWLEPVTASAPLPWHTRPLLGFGTSLALRVAHADASAAGRALDAGVQEIRQIESQMSLFDPDSALSRLNRDGHLADPAPVLLEVLRLTQAVSERSAGAFDPTVQPLWQLFARSRAAGTLPTPAQVRAVRGRIDWRALEVRKDMIRLRRPGMALTLNGIAQGFAADRVRARWHEMGVVHGLINTGEWSALGQAPDGQDWCLGVAGPRDEAQLLSSIRLLGQSLATSSDNQTWFSPDLRHHHILDPRTGFSPPDLASVTVLAPSCALADALTKVIFMAGADKAVQTALAWSVDVLVVDKGGRVQASPGLIGA
ncbi:MAG: FAD:protein FMN transferase [Rhodoferax sp.]|nr:FAD:protein FMN transferase [Rhodoferax sp.]MCF8210045.1 FAD:protein FMN transferase [Rhodoferax sp.]